MRRILSNRYTANFLTSLIMLGSLVFLAHCTNDQITSDDLNSSSTCGEEFLPAGTSITVDEPKSFSDSYELLLIGDGIDVIHNNEELQAIFKSDALIDAQIPDELIDFNFSEHEIIVFVIQRRNNDPLFCFNGLVELSDGGGRALTMGLFDCPDCDFGPRYTFYYLIVPRSEAETVLYLATDSNVTSEFLVVTNSLGI